MPTYAAPGVYVEEVVVVPEGADRGADRGRRLRRLHRALPRPTTPPTPRAWRPGWSPAGRSSRASTAASPRARCCRCRCTATSPTAAALAYIVRVPNTAPSGEPSRRELPAADRALGLPLAVESVEPDADITVADRAPRTRRRRRGPGAVHARPCCSDGDGGRVVPGPDPRQRQAQRRHRRQRDLDQDQGRRRAGRQDATCPASSRCSSRASTRSRRPRPTPVPVTGRKFAGSESARKGINGLAVAEDVTMVDRPRPDHRRHQGRTASIDLGLWKAVQTALITHCEQNGNRMAVLDAPPGMTPQQIKDWRSEVAMYDSAYAALYYPWIKVENPIGVNGDAEVFVPPSGPHRRRLGPHRRDPRRVEGPGQRHHPRRASTSSAASPRTSRRVLNPIGINCIRPFGTRGIRIWGARTLASDTDWRYINVRRLFNMVETTILEGTQWAVFEPNDMALWEGVKRTLNAFLRGLWTCRRAVRRQSRRPGVLRQVRRRDQPAGVDRPGHADRRGRHRAGQAGRVRRLPHQPAEADRQLT